MYKKSKLKNGLTILKVPIRGAKSVLVDVFVKVGSRSEDEKINGASHFLEHLFFKGSRKYPTALDLSHTLDEIGSEYNASTGKEHTQYYIKAAKKHLKFIFETLTDVMRNPVFAEEEIEREKGVIIEEINMYEDTPIRDVDDKLEELMWPGQPLGRNIAGTKDVIRRIARDDIVRYKETFYQPKNMIVSVAGSFSNKDFDALVREHWSNFPSKRFPKWKKAKDKQRSVRVKLFAKNTEQYHLSFGFRSYDYNHKDNPVLAVMAGLLGGGMSSRLFTEVRERRGLAYYVKASNSNYQDTGVFNIKAGVRAEALAQAIEVIVGELKKLKANSVEEEELKKVKEYLKGNLTLSLESNENLLSWYLGQTAFRKKIMSPEELFEKIDKVSPADITRVAESLFQNKKLNLAVVGLKKKGWNFTKLLQI